MIDTVVREIRLIVGNQRDDVAAGNVRRADDGDFVPGNRRIEANVLDEAAWNGTANGDAVEHPRQREIVDVARLAGDLGPAFLA